MNSPDTDNATLDGIHAMPLSDIELRALRRMLYEDRQMAWLKRTGWKWLIGIATFLSALAGAVSYLSSHLTWRG